jgi:uncharacterized protein (TIGR03086 family)
MEPIKTLERATAEFERRLRAITPAQWSDPSPCEGWTVRVLVNHVVSGNRMAVLRLEGSSRDQAIAALKGDLLGDDPVQAFRRGSDEQIAAFERPGALQRTCETPVGDLSGAQLLGFRIGDLTIHAWDLARAIGGDEELDADVVREVWQAMSPMASFIGQTGFFGSGPSGQMRDDAPLQVRLLDLAGRRP